MQKFWLLLFLAAGFHNLHFGQAPVIRFETVVSGLSSPLDIANANDGTNRLFIVQRGGQIRIVQNGALLTGNFLNINGQILSGGEQGLLSIAFHPQYATNRYFFAWYTNLNGDLELGRFRTSAGDPNDADESSWTTILTIAHPGQTNHNGGRLAFGTDGNLYISTGDGGGSNDPGNNGQNGNSLLGKMLRINVDDFADVTPPLYTIPADNPYVGSGDGVLDEICAIGLRNPWRWSFDRQTGDMWIADVGQSAREEVNFRSAANITALTNYGWRCREGEIQTPSVGCPQPPNNVEPIYTYLRSSTTGGFSITGGFVYRGSQYSSLQGWYICADYVSNNIFLIQNNGGGSFTGYLQTVNRIANTSSFGEDENGEMYAVSLTGGILYRVVPDLPLSANIKSFSARLGGNGTHLVQWEILNEEVSNAYELEQSSNGTVFQRIARISAAGRQTYQHTVLAGQAGPTWYRLKVVANDRVYYSSVVVVNENQPKKLQPIVRGGYVEVPFDERFEVIRLLQPDGKVMGQSKVNGAGVLRYTLPASSHGVLIIQWMGAENKTIRIVH
jgi:glucose/arabinose dehydrogenase